MKKQAVASVLQPTLFSHETDRSQETDRDHLLNGEFPITEVNDLAALESYNKHLFRPNTYLHKWWARRSGTTFRHILKWLCPTPDKRDYYAPGGLDGQIILDPMMGGGTTLHEAIRMGASVIGCDIDPIPVLQAQASLSLLPLEDKHAVFQQFYSKLYSILSPLFMTTCPDCHASCETQFVLYGVHKKCDCGETILVDSLKLREEPDGSIIRLCPHSGEVYSGTPREVSNGTKPLILEKHVRQCTVCGKGFEEKKELPYYERYKPLVVVGQCKTHGQFFKPVDAGDRRVFDQAQDLYLSKVQLPYSDFTIHGGPKSNDLLTRGIKNYIDLYSPRQALYLSICKQLIEEVEPEHRLWLALLISTSLEFNALLCGYKGSDKRRPGAIRHVFSYHAYSFPYTALENNPVFSGESSGTLGRLFRDRIQGGTLWAQAPVERKRQGSSWTKVTVFGEVDGGIQVRSIEDLQATPHSFLVMQHDSSKLPLPDESVDHIVTDPPYFDSVQYSDLANFFRVWLRWLLPEAAQWDYTTTDSAVAETERDGLKYQNVLAAIWAQCYRVLKKPSGRLIFTFHHWRAEAWIHLTLSLKRANFRLVTSYTVQSENPISVHIRQLNALQHDSILVLEPDLGDSLQSKFTPLVQISTDDSYTFCSQCAQLLGFCLEAPLTPEEITQVWQKAIGN